MTVLPGVSKTGPAQRLHNAANIAAAMLQSVPT